MSQSYWSHGGLRWWSEREIELREAFQGIAASTVARTLRGMNPAFRIERVEGPMLHPREAVSTEYGDSDLFVTNHKGWVMRPETTPSSYEAARRMGRLPLCVWQAGKSFRREENDGARASRLRFNEFWQQEFQVIYSDSTKADYRAALIAALSPEIARFTGLPVRVVESDRLPSYALSTLDIECQHNGDWREVASCSIRTDYAASALVTEIAIGLCRIATMAAEYEGEAE